VLDASGQPAKVLLREMYSASASVRWDLRTGEVAETDNPPPALAYRWGSGGELTCPRQQAPTLRAGDAWTALRVVRPGVRAPLPVGPLQGPLDGRRCLPLSAAPPAQRAGLAPQART
jgi:hypothetical protein